MTFIDTDLPRAFSRSTTCTCWPTSPMRSAEAVQAVGAYVDYLETDLRPSAKGTFRLGRERFEQKLRLEEGITLPVDRLLAIAMRELARDAGGVPQRCRAARTAAIRSRRGARRRQKHPAPGHADRHRARTAGRAADVPDTHCRSSMLPEGDDVQRRRRRPEFFRWSFASMWTPGPFETRASRAMYYLTDADPSWPERAPDRAPARLQHADALDHLDARGVSRATTSTTSTCARWPRRCGARRCSRPPRMSKAGRTTASR